MNRGHILGAQLGGTNHEDLQLQGNQTLANGGTLDANRWQDFEDFVALHRNANAPMMKQIEDEVAEGVINEHREVQYTVELPCDGESKVPPDVNITADTIDGDPPVSISESIPNVADLEQAGCTLFDRSSIKWSQTMVSSQLQQLARLTGMQENPSRPDWGAVQAAIGFVPPQDYRELIENFGAGLFNYYVQVFGPDERTRSFNLKDSGLYWDGYLRTDWERRPDAVPARLRGREVTLINWGSTEDALEFFRVAEPGTAPSQWEIAFQPVEDIAWEFYEESTVEVLLAFVRGELPSSLLEPYPPGRQITYTPYP